MERLSQEQELLIARFNDQLSIVVGPDDMFPPDTDGVREPLPRPLPLIPAAESLCLYGLLRAQRNRTIIDRSEQILARIDELVGA